MELSTRHTLSGNFDTKRLNGSYTGYLSWNVDPVKILNVQIFNRFALTAKKMVVLIRLGVVAGKAMVAVYPGNYATVYQQVHGFVNSIEGNNRDPLPDLVKNRFNIRVFVCQRQYREYFQPLGSNPQALLAALSNKPIQSLCCFTACHATLIIH